MEDWRSINFQNAYSIGVANLVRWLCLDGTGDASEAQALGQTAILTIPITELE